MNIRQRTEQIERQILSEAATLSKNSKGRQRKEPECDVRSAFQHDRDRIIHCKSFRRLKHKTQVFIAKEGDHYRERLTHTFEVMQIARTIARGLRLNEDLTEAIALGHDLGHTAFGHAGEAVLDSLAESGFQHNEQSLRVVDFLEKDGRGLNLTFEVRDGILNHRTSRTPATPEGKIVRLSDKIAYINHDIDDSLRSEELDFFELPKDCIAVLGETHSERINTMVLDVISNSQGTDIRMSDEVGQATGEMRKFLFQNVYNAPSKKKEEHKASYLMKMLYRYFMEQQESMPSEYEAIAENEGRERAVCDFIAGMTDNYAIRMFDALFVPGRELND